MVLLGECCVGFDFFYLGQQVRPANICENTYAQILNCTLNHCDDAAKAKEINTDRGSA